MEFSALLKDLKNRAASRRKEHERIIRKLKEMKPREVEFLLEKEHQEVFSRIDCLDCANCCRTLGPRLTEPDVRKLSGVFRKNGGRCLPAAP